MTWAKSPLRFLRLPKIQRAVTVVVVLLGPSILLAQSGPQGVGSEPPVWSVKAVQVGYRVSDFRNFRPTVGGDVVRIQFLNSEHLALSWLTPASPPTRVIGPATDVAASLNIAILDSRSGRRISYHKLPCNSLGVNIAYTASGQWLVSSGQSVVLYSASFDKISEIQDVRTQRSHTFVSPTGRTFLTYSSDSPNHHVAQLRDSATLRILDSWDDPRVEKAHILYSDRFVLAQILRPPALRMAYVRQVGGTWNPYSQDNLAKTGTCFGFANDDTLACLSSRELIAETIDGKELFKSMLPQPGLFLTSWSKPAVAKNGERFAIILDRFRGLRNETLDM